MQHRYRLVRAAAPLAVAMLACGVTSASASAARPALSAPHEAEQGRAVSFTIEPKGAQRCVLGTRGPGGRLHTHRVPGGKGYALDARIRQAAATGRWTVQVRCGGRRSQRRHLFVSGFGVGAGGALVERLDATRFGRTPVRRLSPLDQLSPAGPQVAETPLDGLGAAGGSRAEGAIAWALARQGDTSYYFWCLKFVAHAFGVNSSGWGTAQRAADALGARDRAAGPNAAPRGALVFFRYLSGGISYGHVGIALGDGRMVHAVATVRVEALSSWSRSYLGWAHPPAHWPGRFSPPADPTPSPSPAPRPGPGPAPAPSPIPPAATPRRVIVVDNRVTNGMGMREDTTPARLNTKPWIRCSTRGCIINGTERGSGGTYDAAVCQTTGERTTNGHDTSAADDANPLRFESTRYYGVRLGDGTFGYVSEVWIRAADRGGLGLPAC